MMTTKERKQKKPKIQHRLNQQIIPTQLLRTQYSVLNPDIPACLLVSVVDTKDLAVFLPLLLFLWFIPSMYLTPLYLRIRSYTVEWQVHPRPCSQHQHDRAIAALLGRQQPLRVTTRPDLCSMFCVLCSICSLFYSISILYSSITSSISSIE